MQKKGHELQHFPKLFILPCAKTLNCILIK